MSLIYFYGCNDIAEAGFHKTQIIFNLYDDYFIDIPESEISFHLMELIMFSYGNDSYVLSYIKEKAEQYDLDWSVILEGAFARRHPYIHTRKVPNLDVAYYVFTMYPDKITLDTYMTITENFLEHITGIPHHNCLPL